MSSETLGKIGPLQIAILDKFTEEVSRALIRAFHRQNRLPAEQRGRIPIDNGSNVVFVETTAQPFGVNVPRLLLTPHQVPIGVSNKLLASDIQIPVAVPHRTLP